MLALGLLYRGGALPLLRVGRLRGRRASHHMRIRLHLSGLQSDPAHSVPKEEEARDCK